LNKTNSAIAAFPMTQSGIFLQIIATSNLRGGVNHMQVSVRDNNVDQALRVLKKKLQREGVLREMKLKQQFEKPSEKKARQKAEAIRRARKLARKKLEREG
jgi:small subunit ribosomal protein S21